MGKPSDMDPVDYKAFESMREELARKAIDASAKAFEIHKDTGAECGIAAEAFSRLSIPSEEGALKHTDSVMLPFTLTWKFGVDVTENIYPGDHTADTTVFTDRSEYHAALAKQCEVAQGDRRIHRIFAGAMLPKDKRYRLWEVGYPQKPYTYQSFKPLSLLSTCTTCDGTGESPCSGCNGSGKSECSTCQGRGDAVCGHCGGSGETREKVGTPSGNAEDVARVCPFCVRGRETCKPCKGSGEEACFVCNGSGKQPCETCKGAGRFTQVSVVRAIATPELAHGSTALATSPYGTLFADWLKNASLTARDFWAKLAVRPSVEAPKATAGGFSVKYYALPTFIKLRFTLTTVSGQPVEFTDYLLASGDSLKPPKYLDQMLPELAQSLEIGTKGLFLSWRRALRLYKQMSNYRVLADLMKSMAVSPKVSHRVHVDHVFSSDNRWTISDKQAMQIGKAVEKVMSVLSRRTSPFVWIVVTLLFGGYGFLLESASAYNERFAMTDMQIIPLLTLLTVPFFVSGYVASRLVVWRRHRHLSREHRKKRKERVAVLLSMVACVSITFAGNAAARYKVVPPPGLIQAQELVSRYTRETYTRVSLWISTQEKHAGRH